MTAGKVSESETTQTNVEHNADMKSIQNTTCPEALDAGPGGQKSFLTKLFKRKHMFIINLLDVESTFNYNTFTGLCRLYVSCSAV